MVNASRARSALPDTATKRIPPMTPARGGHAMPVPIALTDAQMAAILAAATPLAAGNRNPFLLEVAQALQGLPEIGDGVLHRVIMQVQRKHFDAPLHTGDAHAPRHAMKAR